MNRRSLACLAGALCLSTLVGSVPAVEATVTELRVCADPFTLPYSNRDKQGFENKIAEVLANDLGATLSLVWWPQRRGILRAMQAGACDVVIGVPKDYDPVLTTRPYYRSAYAVVTRKDSGLSIASMNDPKLRSVRIGVQENSPAHERLAEQGITKNVKGYVVNYNPDTPEVGDIVADVASGKIDLAIVWGPLAGFYVKRSSVPLAIVPILDNSNPRMPFVYEFSVGVRRRAREILPDVDAAVARRQADITRILEEYGVPLVPETAMPKQSASPEAAK
jgi:mxaJ protein